VFGGLNVNNRDEPQSVGYDVVVERATWMMAMETVRKVALAMVGQTNQLGDLSSINCP